MKRIGVLGSGTMGTGIIKVLALSGYNVFFRSRKEESVDKCLESISKSLERMITKEMLDHKIKEEVMNRINGSTDISIILSSDIVIEAATEDLESKKKLFKEIDKLCKPNTIFATNSSSLSITEIASATTREDRVIGMHFFNPVPSMKLVEIITGVKTSDNTKELSVELIKSLNKVPVEVKESPGFVVNRMLVPMINEGIGILAEGVSTSEDIDNSMILGANHPIGPLALADLIGLDVCLAVMETLYKEFSDPKYRPHVLLRKMVRAGKLGKKTGEGFYQYK